MLSSIPCSTWFQHVQHLQFYFKLNSLPPKFLSSQCNPKATFIRKIGTISDRTLSCREHLSHSAAKLQSRNNLTAKLAGAIASTLRISALALCYLVAEYCCPVWARSSYTNLINTQLHSAMCLISDCQQPTQFSWMPVLSNVAPPRCRKAATDNMLQIIETHPNWPVYADVFEHPPPWLASRRPIWSDMTPVNTVTQWKED